MYQIEEVIIIGKEKIMVNFVIFSLYLIIPAIDFVNVINKKVLVLRVYFNNFFLQKKVDKNNYILKAVDLQQLVNVVYLKIQRMLNVLNYSIIEGK